MDKYNINISADGSIYRHVNYLYHNDNGPAVECISSNSKSWYIDGYLHREGAPAVVCDDGDESWYKKGVLHRKGGPAITHVLVAKYWLLNGVRHREDGPAVERYEGDDEWWLNGEELTEREYGAVPHG